jgi:nitrite reductase/ring-hydroxylating ferredoxin subunit
MDWQEGRFLDDMGEAIVCTVHGAMYAAGDGRCIGGPCGRGRLITVPVSESDGWVHWYPSRDVSPLPAATAEPGSAP